LALLSSGRSEAGAVPAGAGSAILKWPPDANTGASDCDDGTRKGGRATSSIKTRLEVNPPPNLASTPGCRSANAGSSHNIANMAVSPHRAVDLRLTVAVGNKYQPPLQHRDLIPMVKNAKSVINTKTRRFWNKLLHEAGWEARISWYVMPEIKRRLVPKQKMPRAFGFQRHHIRRFFYHLLLGASLFRRFAGSRR